MNENENTTNRKTVLEGLLLNKDRTTGSSNQETSVLIKALLMLRNVSQAEIAEKYKLSKSDLCKVINGKRRTQRIREAIATELSIPATEIWKKF